MCITSGHHLRHQLGQFLAHNADVSLWGAQSLSPNEKGCIYSPVDIQSGQHFLVLLTDTRLLYCNYVKQKTVCHSDNTSANMLGMI